MFSIFLGTLLSNTFLIYIQDTVGWAVGYSLPNAGLVVSIMVFIVGTRYYRHMPPSGSPLTRMARMLVATLRKWRVVVLDEPKELHELPMDHYSGSGLSRLDHSSSLSFLDKAAVKTSSNSPWMLCPVTQVEQTKHAQNDPNTNSNIHIKHPTPTDTNALRKAKRHSRPGPRPSLQDTPQEEEISLRGVIDNYYHCYVYYHASWQRRSC